MIIVIDQGGTLEDTAVDTVPYAPDNILKIITQTKKPGPILKAGLTPANADRQTIGIAT